MTSLIAEIEEFGVCGKFIKKAQYFKNIVQIYALLGKKQSRLDCKSSSHPCNSGIVLHIDLTATPFYNQYGVDFMINLGKISNFSTSKDILLQQCENGCIKCISHCKDKDGYVRIRYKGKNERLFRVLYQQKYGEIPKGMVLRHLCNNSWCCNIEHLKIGTHKENMEDMVRSGRSCKYKGKPQIRGTKNVSNKLNEEQVKEIYLSKLSFNKLSKLYGVSKTNISLIKNKKQWKWFTDNLD